MSYVVPIGPAALHGEFPREGQVVGGFFGNLFKKFGNMLKHVAAVAIDIGSVAFGVPPGVAFAVSELIMKGHAGDPKAKAKIRKLAADPKMKAFMVKVSAAAKAHPEFGAYKQHPHPNAARPR